MESIQNEIQMLMEMFFTCYEHFGFKNIKINLSTRPEKKSGSDETWDQAENALKLALEGSGHEYTVKEGDGAFYGPKIDVEIADALNRYHQLGTIQLDFQLPERFGLKYMNKEGTESQPVVIHRALLGSLERFIGVYLEHVAGAFPFWIAPEQAVIVPVNNDSHLEFAKTLQLELHNNDHRVRIDDRNESMGYKTRQIQKAKIPFMIVIGDREIENNSVSLRSYGAKFSTTISIEELKNNFSDLAKEKTPEKLRVRS
jgi:threonyl-tRNA synthetase